MFSKQNWSALCLKCHFDHFFNFIIENFSERNDAFSCSIRLSIQLRKNGFFRPKR